MNKYSYARPNRIDTSSETMLFQQRTNQNRHCAICGTEIPWHRPAYCLYGLGNNIDTLEPICEHCWDGIVYSVEMFNSQRHEKIELLKSLQQAMADPTVMEQQPENVKQAIPQLIQSLLDELNHKE